jgi:hypothetical protein
MGYELADGSMSTDYQIGDEFTHERESLIFRLMEDDGTQNPWFKVGDCEGRNARHWEDLTPIKRKNSTLINRLHATIRQLEATIKELEQ